MKWQWDKFVGSKEMLRYMKRDVGFLAQTVKDHVPVPARKVAVQAGGALGLFPKYLSQQFEYVYTFEPDPQNFMAMLRNAPEENIIKFQAALGAERSLVNISHERRSYKPGNAHEGIRHVEGPGPIPTLMVDDLGLDRCDLLYLDIEGHELFALQGAAETIKQTRPVIVIEMNEMMAHAGVTEDRVLSCLDGYGYEKVAKVGSSDHLFKPRPSTWLS